MAFLVRHRAVVILALLMTLGASLVPAAANADMLVTPQLYARLFSSYNDQPWVPLSGTVTSMGPYELGIQLPLTGTGDNEEGVEIDLDSSMGSDPLEPYQPYCALRKENGTIVALGGGGILYYTGNGAYGIDVSTYTYAQYEAFPGSTCNGGPATAYTMTVDATTTARIEGTPLAPRTTRQAHGFVGLGFTTPVGDIGDEWRCAINPVFAADGSVSGTIVTHDRSISAADRAVVGAAAARSTADSYQVSEAQAFTRPGRWACVARGLGGNENDGSALAPTPWGRTPTITVKGQYARSNSRLALAAHHRMRLTVYSLSSIAAAAAHGRLTLTIARAICTSGLKQTFKLHTVVKGRARVDARGHAVFSFRSPSADGFYLGRLSFGGTSLILPGADVPIYFALLAPSHTVHFVDPDSWAVCD